MNLLKPIKKHYHKIIIVLVFLVVVLSAFIFSNQGLFIGGDNSRLFLYYPKEYLQFISTGINFSDYPLIGAYKPIYHLFLYEKLLLFSSFYINTKYLSIITFTIINFGGFLGMYFLLSLFHKNRPNKLMRICLSLLYILIPTTFIAFNSFFAGVFIVGVGPWFIFLTLSYLKKPHVKYLVYLSILCLIFGVIFYAIPWIIPIIWLILIYVIIYQKDIKFRHIITVSVILFLSSLYWMIPFGIQFQEHSSQYSNINKQELKSSFVSTVTNTSKGNSIIYPLAGFFHKSIAENYNWEFFAKYNNYYSYGLILGIIFFFISFWFIFLKKKSNTYEKEVLFIKIALLLYLFLFTVNVGFFKDLFLIAGENIPMFGIFRNFYDKFGLAYSIVFILFLYIGLGTCRSKKLYVLLFMYFLFLLLPFIVGYHINSKIWQTNIGSLPKNIDSDYLHTLNFLQQNNTIYGKNIFLPLSISQYNFVPNTMGVNQAYIGLDPGFILKDVKNIVGYNDISKMIDSCVILDKLDFQCFIESISKYNIEYIVINEATLREEVFIFNNITRLYTQLLQNFLAENIGIFEQIGNFRVYSLGKYHNGGYHAVNKISNGKFYLFLNIDSLKKISFKYFYSDNWKLYLEPYSELDCKNPKTNTGTIIPETKIYKVQAGDDFNHIASKFETTKEKLIDLNPNWDISGNSYLEVDQEIQVPKKSESNSGGETYSVTECQSENKIFVGDELSKLWQKSIFDDTHTMVYDYANQWTIDPEYIKANYPKEYYKENPDGSIDIRLTLYFKPQSYFYLGLIISGTTFLILVFYLIIDSIRVRRKNK